MSPDVGPCPKCFEANGNASRVFKNLGAHMAMAHGMLKCDRQAPADYMQPITCHVPVGQLHRVDDAVLDGRAPNRSEFIRLSIAFYLQELKKP